MLSKKSKTGIGSRPYLRNKNVQWGRFDLSDVAEMDFSEDEFQKFRLRDGDLLVCEGGEVGRAAIWREAVPDCAFQKALHRIRTRDGVTPEFIYYLLRHYGYSNAFERFVTGSTIRHLPQEDLRLLPVPLPPLPEQQRIVAVIEEQFSRLDAATASLERATRVSDRLVSSLLADAALGRLLYTSTPTRGQPDGLAALPSDWVWATVGEVGRLDLGRQRAPRYHSGPNMRPYLRVANVFEDRIDLSDVKEMDFDEGDFAKYRLEPGDVLLNEGQSPEWLGRPALYRGELPGVCFTNTLIRFRAAESVLPEFALLVFRHLMRSGRFARESRITTNIAHLSVGRLKTVEFPLPPLSDQRRTVNEAEARLSIAASLKTQTRSSTRRADGIRRAILRDAFAGRLVRREEVLIDD
jgi:type I restriction enzyme S subunit